MKNLKEKNVSFGVRDGKIFFFDLNLWLVMTVFKRIAAFIVRFTLILSFIMFFGLNLCFFMFQIY